LLTGLSGSAANTNGGGYLGQIADARSKLANAKAEEEQNKTKLTMHERELKELEARYKSVERESGEGKRRVAAMQQEVEKLRGKVASCGWDEEKENRAEAKIRETKQQVRAYAEVCVASL
jgi:structural maintenance of chromosome 2